MSVRWYTTVIDCHDISAQARWWAEVLGWKIAFEADDEVAIVPPQAFDESRDIPVEERGPGLVFVRVPEDKQVKNRLHLDLAPRAADDQAVEVAGESLRRNPSRRRAGSRRALGRASGSGRKRVLRTLAPRLTA